VRSPWPTLPPEGGTPAAGERSRLESLETLARFGVAGRLAIPRLREFQKHANPWVRMSATEALLRIAPRTSVTAPPYQDAKPVQPDLPRHE
jgi:hypothetical protein